MKPTRAPCPRDPSTSISACSFAASSAATAVSGTTSAVTDKSGYRPASCVSASRTTALADRASASLSWTTGTSSACQSQACTIRSDSPRSVASRAAQSAAARLSGDPSTPTAIARVMGLPPYWVGGTVT